MSVTVTYWSELEDIRIENGGILRPEDVVERARNPNNVLHSKFTWDDDDAAHKWRLHQARNLIRMCVTVSKHTNRTVHAYVSLTTDRYGDSGYRSMPECLSDPVQRELVLEDAFMEFDVFRRKYEHLQELAPLYAAAEEIKAASKGKRTRKVTAKVSKTRGTVPV